MRRRAHAGARAALALAGVLTFTVMAMPSGATPVAHASVGPHFQRGYSLQQGWLCFGWSNGAFHCTQRWHRAGSRLISDNPSWVPTVATGATMRPKGMVSGVPLRSSLSPTPARIGPWVPPPGRFAFAMRDFRGDPNAAFFGVCTWYAWFRHQNEPLMRLGNAGQWPFNARRLGLRTGTIPVPGATVVFQGGVQGADAIGHAAHVEAVYANGWFLVSEMAFVWNGGGWGRVNYRYVHTGFGVSFIY